MPDAAHLAGLLAGLRADADLRRVDRAAADAAVAALQAALERCRGRFDAQRAISAQVAAARPPELRRALLRVRRAAEELAIGEAAAAVERGLARSGEAGWIAWLEEVTAGVPFGYWRHAVAVCERPFRLDPSRRPTVARVRRALELMRQGRWDEAYDDVVFLSGLEVLSAPGRGRLVAVAGAIESSLFQDHAAGRRLLEAADALAPGDGSIAAALGDLWLAQGDAARAAEWFRRAVEVDPEAPGGYAGLGDVAEKAGKAPEAEGWYREAVAHAGGDTTGHRRLVRLLGRPDVLAAREAELVAVVDEALALEPEDAYDLCCVVGERYLEAKRLEDARRWYERAIAQEPSWPVAHVALGRAWRAGGDDDRAAACCRIALAAAPEYPEASFLLAAVHEARGAWGEALALYARCAGAPRGAGSYARASAAKMQLKLGAREEAERALWAEVRAAADRRFARAALEGLAIEHRDRGELDAARGIYDRLREALGAPYAGAYHNALGNLRFFVAEYGPAAEEYERAVAAEPGGVVYRRNLAGAYRELERYDDAEAALQAADGLDGGAGRGRDRALLLNARGNAAFAKGRHREAAGHYAAAAELDPEAVYLSNLAGAWEALREPGRREEALDEALRVYERLEARSGPGTRAAQLERLRLRKAVAHACGEGALDRLNVVTPIAVEVAADLIPFVEGAERDTIAPELATAIAEMRSRLEAELGVKVPGLRFRGNEGDLAAGTYVILLDEIPVVSGQVSTGRRYCVAPADRLAALAVKGEEVVDPVTGRGGTWIGPADGEAVERARLPLLGVAAYLVRHVEAVLRRNLADFVGPQEVANALDAAAPEVAEELRRAPRALAAFTSACRALVAEEAPARVATIADAFRRLHAERLPLREIVERLRLLPEVRAALAGNEGRRAFLRLGPGFEATVRRSLYRGDGAALLAMEPEPCQEALAALRAQVGDEPVALLVGDPALRPFVRRLVEPELPHLPVLAAAEVADPEASRRARVVELATPPPEPLEFPAPWASGPARGPDGPAAPPASPALAEVSIAVSVSEDFASLASAADAEPLDRMLELMCEGLFHELGLVLPVPRVAPDPSLRRGWFRVRVNGVERTTRAGLAPDELLVNDTPERLAAVLRLEARPEGNPANGAPCAVVRDAADGRARKACEAAGLTIWGPKGFLVLQLAADVRRAAAELLTVEGTRFALDTLGVAFPDLVRLALDRHAVPQLARVLQELLREGVSIRDLRRILGSLVALDGTTDVDQGRFIVFTAHADNLCPAPRGVAVAELGPAALADFVRTCLKREIAHRYARDGTLAVYLLDAETERRVADPARPLAPAERDGLVAAIGAELRRLPPGAAAPAILTSQEVRRPLREAIARALPDLAVLGYQELSLDVNVQPIARIAWGPSAERLA